MLTQCVSRNVSELQVRVDGVNVTPRHRDAVEVSVRASARLASEPRQFRDGMIRAGKDAFDDVLEEFNWTIPQLRDQRYEAVVHLVTAAIGAERFYTLENNKARMVRYRRPVVLGWLHFVDVTRI